MTTVKNVNYPWRLLKRPFSVQKNYPRDISRMDGFSGSFQCRLVAHTPLEINYGRDTGSNQRIPFHKDPKIPGSSLKGVLRSVAEYVGGGCFSIRRNPSSGWESCQGPRVCVTCAMFGKLQGQEVLRGRVLVGEGLPAVENGMRLFEKHPVVKLYQGSPREHHTAFYISNGGGLPLQKFYHHQPEATFWQAHPNATSELYPVKAGSAFDFKVQFSGLDARMLALLEYSLALQPGLLHKMGRGKAHGLGSVKIVLRERLIFSAAERYLGSGEASAALPAEAQTELLRWQGAPELDSFRTMLFYEGAKGVNFSFPGFAWFRAPRNAGVGLRPAKQVVKPYTAAQDPKVPVVGGTAVAVAAPSLLGALPKWAAGDFSGEEWGKVASLQRALQEVAALKYNPGLISKLLQKIEEFKKTEVGSLEERAYLAAFRAMFAKEKDFKTFQREKLGR